MKALVGAFNQEKAIVGAFSVIVQPVVEPMDRFKALVKTILRMKTVTKCSQDSQDSSQDISPQPQTLEHLTSTCLSHNNYFYVFTMPLCWNVDA